MNICALLIEYEKCSSGSNDKHFDILKDISFPKISVLKLQGFLSMLK
jgi:hypothetical protein